MNYYCCRVKKKRYLPFEIGNDLARVPLFWRTACLVSQLLAAQRFEAFAYQDCADIFACIFLRFTGNLHFRLRIEIQSAMRPI